MIFLESTTLSKFLLISDKIGYLNFKNKKLIIYNKRNLIKKILMIYKKKRYSNSKNKLVEDFNQKKHYFLLISLYRSILKNKNYVNENKPN